MMVCEVCGDGTGACRFEKACSCWRGEPCMDLAEVTDANERDEYDAEGNYR
jgi:hypothetical protein